MEIVLLVLLLIAASVAVRFLSRAAAIRRAGELIATPETAPVTDGTQGRLAAWLYRAGYRARKWIAAVWENNAGAISWQVLNELYRNATAKMNAPAPGVQALMRTYAKWRPVNMSLPLAERAWHWSDRADIAFWIPSYWLPLNYRAAAIC
jgi:hypothetical protein